MQLFYISNKPVVLNGTLDLVEKCMDFIHEVIVVVPTELMPQVKINFRFKLHILPEEEFIDASAKAGLDHSSLNYQIRTNVLLKYNGLEDEFIMSDDDYRPLIKFDMSKFKSEDKYRSYYFYDLKKWKHKITPFDHCLQNSLGCLSDAGMPTMAYASHMPQLINKKIFKESIQFFMNKSKVMSLCEWSTYFNYAHTKYPALFHKPEPYANICWPDYPNIWKRYVEPQDPFFENYYEHLYNDGDLFEQIDEVVGTRNLEANRSIKLERIRLFQAENHIPYMSYRAKYISNAIKFFNRSSPFIRKQVLITLKMMLYTKRQIVKVKHYFF